ncbi:MAG: type I DNA topoisomerase [Planctomycetota bacterium]
MAAARSKKPAGKPLVIVESPAKAKTISRFLGGEYEVQASIGHVRDLPERGGKLPEKWKGHPRARLGVDIENDFEPMYVVPDDKKDQIRALKRLLADAPALWLATDEDREGESISWHLLEVLDPKVPVHRLVFHEITKSAIEKALTSPRDIDLHLVKAQEARRILDRLVGYEVSPVLWRRIKPRLSAGRVQSVALRLLVEREQERIAFHSAEFWDLAGRFAPVGKKADAFEAQLVEVAGKRVASGRDFDPATGRLGTDARDVTWLDAQAAQALHAALASKTAKVLDVEEKPLSQRPAAPFTTSTLQQEAGRKLRFASKRTMQVAQRLYENGWITYMRTDSTELSSEALGAARSLIARQYGNEFLPTEPRTWRTKVKNAQEAHEAIRPAGSSFATIDAVRKALDRDAAALYELIWKRTVASQMPDARGRRVTVRVGIGDAVFRASGKIIDFPGFMRAYVEGSDDPQAELAEAEHILPPVQAGQTLDVLDLEAKQHQTQAPARYTEASLVKELDERGIGRPSTWSSIIGVLLERSYAFKKGTALVPTYTAFAVIRLLKRHFSPLCDYDFTAHMEDDLDEISLGRAESREYLRRFWAGNGQPGLETLVEKGMAEADPRELCGFTLGTTDDGRTIEVRVGKYGLFLTDGEVRASVDDEVVPDELGLAKALELLAEAARGPQALGDDPETGRPVFLLTGRYGPYVQLGDQQEDEDLKRVSLLDGMDPEQVDLDLALRLLGLPRDLGPSPDDPSGEHVMARVGRYGPYVTCGKESRSLPRGASPLEVTLGEALELLRQPRRGRGQQAPAAPLRELGAHPQSGLTLKILDGRYGPYVTDGTVNASLPKGTAPESLTMEEAVDLLAKRAARLAAGGGRGRGKKPAKKKAAKKKSATKKAAKKKAAPRKKAARKKA